MCTVYWMYAYRCAHSFFLCFLEISLGHFIPVYNIGQNKLVGRQLIILSWYFPMFLCSHIWLKFTQFAKYLKCVISNCSYMSHVTSNNTIFRHILSSKFLYASITECNTCLLIILRQGHHVKIKLVYSDLNVAFKFRAIKL